MSVNDTLQCAVAAEKAGFEYISVAESFYRDGFALASAIATNTRRIKFGTSVMPIYTRTPFQIAMGAATLQEISDSRLGFLGLGVGYRNRTEQYFGIKSTAHVERMKEYVDIIRILLSDDANGYRGKFFSFKEFPKLSPKPLNLPIYFGSSGPKMLKLAGELADGAILNSISTPEYVEFALERIAEGADKARRDYSKLEIGHSIIYACSDDREEAARAAKEDILFYFAYPELDPVIEKSSFKKEAMKMRSLFVQGKKDEAISMVTDEMLDVFSVYGTPKECRTKLDKFLSRGISLPIIRVSNLPYKENEKKDVFMRAINSLK